jgi:uncharacterized membrane protein YphA (DoxX/SURF4 family)
MLMEPASSNHHPEIAGDHLVQAKPVSAYRRLDTAMEWHFGRLAPTVLRCVLALTLFSAVADRWGAWGDPGTRNVSWGDWAHFVAYTAQVNSFLPAAFAPQLALAATAAEIVLGVALLLGLFPRWTALFAAGLFVLFAVAMTISFGVKSPFNFSVWADAAAAFALCAWPKRHPLTGGCPPPSVR